MVLKSVFLAAICTVSVASVSLASAAEYRRGEYLNLDLPKAVLAPKRLGPEAEFAPVRIEARTDGAEADLDASVWPPLPPRKAHAAKSRVAKTEVAKTEVAKTGAEPPHAAARGKLARRSGNPLDAQARDTRIQTWPCKSGGICNWGR